MTGLFGGIEFGLPLGLAYRHDFDKDFKNKVAITQIRRQTRVDAENKARLFAKENESIRIRNPFDAAVLDRDLSKLWKEKGKWISDNPDYLTDDMLQLYYQENYVRPIKDNKPVRRDMSYQQNKKLLQTALSKQGETPQLMKMLEQSENYRLYGNFNGQAAFEKEGVKEFVFTAPFDGFDAEKIINNSFKELVPGPDSADTDKYGGIWYEVSESEAKGAIKQNLADDTFEGYWEDYLEKNLPKGSTEEDLVEHLYQQNKGKLPRKYGGRLTTDSSGRQRMDRRTAIAPILFKSDILDKMDAKRSLGVPQEIFGDEVASYNMLVNPDGRTVSIRQGAAMKIERINPDGTIRDTKFIDFPMRADMTFSTEGGWRRMTRPKAGIPVPMLFSEVWVDVDEDTAQEIAKPMQEVASQLFEDIPGVYESGEIFDLQGWNNIFRTIDEPNDVKIRTPFRETVRVKTDPDDPGKVIAIQFKIWNPTNISTANLLHYDNTVLNKRAAGKVPVTQPGLEPNVVYDISGVKMTFQNYNTDGSPNWKTVK